MSDSGAKQARPMCTADKIELRGGLGPGTQERNSIPAVIITTRARTDFLLDILCHYHAAVLSHHSSSQFTPF